MCEIPFPVTEDIAPLLFNYFIACNRASKSWTYKQDFYTLKNLILDKHGRFDGYDLQIIEKRCWSCNGTGEYCNYYSYQSSNGKEECWKCDGTGVYEKKAIALMRYVLNDQLFHRPFGAVKPGQAYFTYQELKVQYHNTIKGIIEHVPVPDIDLQLAFVQLLAAYHPQRLVEMVFNRDK